MQYIQGNSNYTQQVICNIPFLDEFLDLGDLIFLARGSLKQVIAAL